MSAKGNTVAPTETKLNALEWLHEEALQGIASQLLGVNEWDNCPPLRQLHRGREHICPVHRCTPVPSTVPGMAQGLKKYLLTGQAVAKLDMVRDALRV